MAKYKSFKSAAKGLKRFIDDPVKKAGVRSINRAIDATRTLAVRTVAEESGAKQKDIRSRFGNFKASTVKPKGAMIAFSKPVSLAVFGPKRVKLDTARGRRIGWTVNTPRGRVLSGGSLTKYKSGKKNLFRREAGKIVNLKTDAPYRYVAKPSVMGALRKHASESFEKNFRHEVKRAKLTESD